MVLKLYGVPVSQPVRAVMWACTYKGLPYSFVMTMPGRDKKGGSRSPEYLSMNPSGTVPAIDDDGFVIAESNAILTYLAEKYGWGDLYPTDVQKRAKINEYLHWHHRNTREITVCKFAPIVRPDVPISKDTLARSDKTVRGIVKHIDNRLAQNKFVAGDFLSIADFNAYCEVGQCDSHLCNLWNFDDYPNVQRWMRYMEGVKGYEEVHEGLRKFLPILEKMKAKAKL